MMAGEAKKLGVDAEGLSSILQDTADRVGEFTRLGEGEFVDIYEQFFKPIGIGAQELKDMRPEVVLMTLQEQMTAAGIAANEQKSIYEQLASDSSHLADVWGMTTDQLVKLNEAKRDKGEIFSADEVQRGNDIYKKVQEMKSSFVHLGAAIVLAFEKPLSWAFDAVNSLANFLTDILITTDTERLEAVNKEIARLQKKNPDGYSYIGTDAQRILDEQLLNNLIGERAQLEKQIADTRKEQAKELIPYKAADDAKGTPVDDTGTAYGEKTAEKNAKTALAAYRLEQKKIKDGKRKIDQEFAALDRFELLANAAITSLEDDPLVKMELDLDEKLKELRKAYMESDLADTQTFVEASKAIWQEYYDSLKQMNNDTLQNNLNGASQFSSALSNSFGALADAMDSAGKSGSNAYKAAIVAQKTFALTSASLALGQAVAQAYAAPDSVTVAQKFANAAAITSAVGGVISSISSIAYGGGRKYGGGVSAGKMYEFGENGVEMFQSGAKNYMLPGRDGTVIPSGSVGGGYVINQTFNVESGQLENPETLQRLMQATKMQTMQIMQQQTMQGGMLAR
ncbi:hypothetical protein [Vibrio harveyi]|uniref:hypothetical protein n=1 Tax=Vibrio harveyi TaxID=669 RepID=UPI0018F1AA8A|nr:hypothetical protein [Vibrio harveyi]